MTDTRFEELNCTALALVIAAYRKELAYAATGKYPGIDVAQNQRWLASARAFQRLGCPRTGVHAHCA